ncbi:hypothetical protein MARINON1_60016 [Marinobacter salarius]|nr:hypothetical protein MARINON1_60016 [Marinobacter salarius]
MIEILSVSRLQKKLHWDIQNITPDDGFRATKASRN